MNRRPVLIVGVGLVMCATLAGCSSSSKASVTVTPAMSELSQQFDVNVAGLHPHEVVTIKLSSSDAHEIHWASHAEFAANSDGNIDLNAATSLRGSYVGVQPMGLVNTLAPTTSVSRSQVYWWHGTTPQPFTASVVVNGHSVAT